MAPGDGSRHFSAYHPYLRSRALCRLWASGSPASFTPLPPCSSSTLRRLSKFAQHVTEVNEPPVPRFSSEPRFLLACRAGKKRRVASDGRTARNGGSDRECRIRPSDRHSSWRPPVGGGRSREPSPTEVRMGKSRSSVMRASRRRPQRGR